MSSEFENCQQIRLLHLYKFRLDPEDSALFRTVSASLENWETYLHEAIQAINLPTNALEAEDAKNKLTTALKFKLMIAEYTLEKKLGFNLLSKTELENHTSSNLNEDLQKFASFDDVYYTLDYDADLIEHLEMIDL
jgi:hypothetical protein